MLQYYIHYQPRDITQSTDALEEVENDKEGIYIRNTSSNHMPASKLRTY
jgi:hypothetical protein